MKHDTDFMTQEQRQELGMGSSFSSKNPGTKRNNNEFGDLGLL
jgi:hypothetical protein